MNPLPILRSIPSHASRVSVIALHAFTQLVRMKVFYFLGFFAVILIASNFFNLPQHEGPESAGVNILRSIKSWSLGAMTLFSVVLSIVATALLLPKDVEDRTLYTILAKPVPRLDYLAGKLIGVLLLIFVSLALMDILMTVILHLRTNMVLADQVAAAEARGWPAGDIQILKSDILAQGPTASLQGAVFSVFLRSTIIASLALLISTFSSSTLFTTIISFLIYFIGHFQADARAAYFSQEAGTSDGWFTKMISLLVALILPDFQIFNVIDAVIEGQVMPVLILGKLTLIGLFYAVFYVIASWFIFAKKEF
ncbi:MAG: ABC transporter permease subunit [Armatimonadetes bacterium]|nr:ABC transporter permease subunit [Akkermansiaceae bacterium]